MRFVLANRLMNRAGGSEVHLVTIGVELLRLGHEVVVYAPELGPFADYTRTRGIDVFDNLHQLPEACDVVLSQDGIVVYEVAERYPQALHAFRLCGDVYDFQSPPQLDGVVDLVIAVCDRYARLAEACAVRAPVLRLRVPVDIDRLVPLGAIRERPRRAVILSNYPDRMQAVRDAWEPKGIEVEQLGWQRQRYDIAAALENADIVVAKNRAALDAMACGRAVYVYDLWGGDGWVKPDGYAAMEADYFTGQATDRVIGPAELERDLAEYDPGMGTVNRDLVVQHHGPRDHVAELLAALPLPRVAEQPRAALRELARLTALQWSWERFARDGQHAQATLHDRMIGAEVAAATAERGHGEALERAESLERQCAASFELAEALQSVRAAAAELRAELDAIHASRAWQHVERYRRLREKLLRPNL